MNFSIVKIYAFFLIVLPHWVWSQNSCKPNKELQKILEKSKVFKNQYSTISNDILPYNLRFVKPMDKSYHLNYKVCNLKMENDSIYIKGYIEAPKNRFLNNVFFTSGIKTDTTYFFEFKSHYVDELIKMGPIEGFYLKDDLTSVINSIDYFDNPEKINFQYKMPVLNKMLFIIGHKGDYADIFDLNALREKLIRKDK